MRFREFISFITLIVLFGCSQEFNVSGKRIIEANLEPENWMSHGRTYDEQRFSPLNQINPENIKEKLRDELRNAVSKENYLSPEDAKLINEFINKLKKELSN